MLNGIRNDDSRVPTVQLHFAFRYHEQVDINRRNSPMHGRYDAIIIGAGHNGLVTACYLAKAGKKVLVLEKRDLVGGACVTEETFPGFKVSTCAYVNSLFRPEIIAELELKKHGFELLE